jgi:hypothetical protein
MMEYIKPVLLIIFAVLCAALVLAFSKEVSGHLNAVYIYIEGLFEDLWGNGLNNNIGRKAGFSLILIALSLGWAIRRFRR